MTVLQPFLAPFLLYTGCPTDMVTRSDQILKIEKSHMSKSKPCFKILELRALRWHFENGYEGGRGAGGIIN